jgi:predicted Rossmann fold flavoprotein
MKIGIVGGGPAGMFSALEASKHHKYVTIIDRNPFLGRKLSASGAGRGNLTNLHVSPQSYSALERFSYSEIVQKHDYAFLTRYFKDMGITTYHTDDGWTYPISNSARNLSLFLEELIQEKNIEILRNVFVKEINFSDDQFQISLDNGQVMPFDRLVISTGGQAHLQLNASDEILAQIEKLGHQILPAYPALSPLNTSKNQSKLLSGVRLDAETRIIANEKTVARTFGNIIFTEWGINGPGVMDLSHYIFKNPGQNKIKINFYNENNRQIIDELLLKFQESAFQLETLLLAVFPKKLIQQCMLNAHMDSNVCMNQLRPEQTQNLLASLSIEESILGTRGFEFCQLSTGAVASSEINPLTLESKRVPNLYFAGEVLDVLGPCGGYNLHWAFVSGIVAGSSIGSS